MRGTGLTETSPATHVLTLRDARRKLGSIGQLLPSLQARVVQADGTEAPTGSPGELLLKGPTVMKWVSRKLMDLDDRASRLSKRGSGLQRLLAQ